ncbi:MAG: PfkB family carbohydrate kinase [Gemmatimonadota bacterium]|jgi:D-beta-D-heptose 7-phosphate kinase/D-beta-D-heptose 1-phosphate adenosyltransferase|nr:PfkB family carbohydrate kinase [Gemmatimonadota bacterium]
MHSLGIDRIEALLNGARDVRVTVIGDLMLDIYLIGSVDRISPEAPVPVVHVTEELMALGGAANVVANVVRLGAACRVIGFAGDDSHGTHIRDELERLEGGLVHTDLVTDGSRPTTAKTRVVAKRQQVVRFDREREDDLSVAATEAIRAAVLRAIAETDVLVLEDYNKGVLTPVVIRTAIEAARAAGVPVIVDPKFRNIFEYRGATVLKPNAFEIVRALGTPIMADNEDWLEDARCRLGCEYLLVTLGEGGMVLRSNNSTFRVPAVAREVFDVSGAGDTVTAFIAVALGAGATVREAMILANFAAAIEVAKPGVATVSPEELKDLVLHLREEIRV